MQLIVALLTLGAWLFLLPAGGFGQVPGPLPAIAQDPPHPEPSGNRVPPDLPRQQNLSGKDSPVLPEEPDEFDSREVKAYYDWRNDLFFREFDMSGSGSANYMTARRTYKVWLDDFGTPIVITVGDPLFYWIDLNGNGEFESKLGEMWSDPDEDGITGNERLYDSSDLQSKPSRIPIWKAPSPQ